MKFALYYLQDTDDIIRCVDGKISKIDQPEWLDNSADRFTSYLNAPEKPCENDIVTRLRTQGTLLTFSRSIAKVNYGVPDNVELYTRDDIPCNG